MKKDFAYKCLDILVKSDEAFLEVIRRIEENIKGL